MSAQAVELEPDAREEGWDRRLAWVAPPVNIWARYRTVWKHQAKALALSALRRVPGLRTMADRSHTQPLHSGSLRLYRWWKAPYGTADKPASLAEIPWDYVEANQDKIPFLGLREYWYPALESHELPHNVARPVTLLGDNLVFFRDAQGRARALENRCPHRSALLSLGQVGVFEPGTITCRYHGMTFQGDGECVAFLADGPDSTACGRVRARPYPVEEHRGVVFVYMGDREPQPFLDAHPHARTVLGQEHMIVHVEDLPYSYLNILDNTVDLAHVGCLHRTCLLFGDQKPFGEIDFEELADGGVRAFFKQPGEHAGQFHIDEIRWYLPNLVYHGPGELGAGAGEGWFWFVPRDIGSYRAWLILSAQNSIARRILRMAVSHGEIPGTACFLGGDAPMQASQGRIPRWDLDRLARTDRVVIKVRRMMQAAHQAEVAERKERAAADQARVRQTDLTRTTTE